MTRSVCSHRSFEARYPAEAAYERAYRPSRDFPCPGTLQASAAGESGLVTVRCDACGWEMDGRPEQLAPLERVPF